MSTDSHPPFNSKLDSYSLVMDGWDLEASALSKLEIKLEKDPNHHKIRLQLMGFMRNRQALNSFEIHRKATYATTPHAEQMGPMDSSRQNGRIAR